MGNLRDGSTTARYNRYNTNLCFCEHRIVSTIALFAIVEATRHRVIGVLDCQQHRFGSNDIHQDVQLDLCNFFNLLKRKYSPPYYALCKTLRGRISGKALVPLPWQPENVENMQVVNLRMFYFNKCQLTDIFYIHSYS